MIIGNRLFCVKLNIGDVRAEIALFVGIARFSLSGFFSDETGIVLCPRDNGFAWSGFFT